MIKAIIFKVTKGFITANAGSRLYNIKSGGKKKIKKSTDWSGKKIMVNA